MNTHDIIEFLETKGKYHKISQPLRVTDLDLEFDFEGVMVGPRDHKEILLISNTLNKSIQSIVRRVTTFSMVLDRLNLPKSFTLLLITESPKDRILNKLNELCRVILISSEKPLDQLDKVLRILLPLNLPNTEKTSRSVIQLMNQELGKDVKDPWINSIMKVANKSSYDVETTVRDKINKMAASAYDNDREDV